MGPWSKQPSSAKASEGIRFALRATQDKSCHR